jgi:hypothetical protein
MGSNWSHPSCNETTTNNNQTTDDVPSPMDALPMGGLYQAWTVLAPTPNGALLFQVPRCQRLWGGDCMKRGRPKHFTTGKRIYVVQVDNRITYHPS